MPSSYTLLYNDDPLHPSHEHTSGVIFADHSSWMRAYQRSEEGGHCLVDTLSAQEAEVVLVARNSRPRGEPSATFPCG